MGVLNEKRCKRSKNIFAILFLKVYINEADGRNDCYVCN